MLKDFTAPGKAAKPSATGALKQSPAGPFLQGPRKLSQAANVIS